MGMRVFGENSKGPPSGPHEKASDNDVGRIGNPNFAGAKSTLFGPSERQRLQTMAGPAL